MARRAVRSRFMRPAPRSNVWLGAGLVVTGVAASATVLLSSLNAAALALLPFTIVRSRLSVFWGTDQAATSEFAQAVFSSQVVTAAAATAGIGSVPTPLTETDADFIIYRPMFSDLRLASAVGFDQTGGNQTFEVDSKAMRKLGIDDQLVFVIENRSPVGTQIAIEGRMLVKLH